jgi:tetratricopeptide (TPR) repeat protein
VRTSKCAARCLFVFPVCFFSFFLLLIPSTLLGQSTLEVWKKNEDAAAAAAQAVHFVEAEELLLSKLAETFPPKDARLPRTLFDLAQGYRAEGKYGDALALYERTLQIYESLYGDQSEELAQTLDGEAELYKALGDYGHAEPLLLNSLQMRKKLLPADSSDIGQTENDLGELYTLTGAYHKAEPLLLDAFSIRQKLGQETPDIAQSFEALGSFYKSSGREEHRTRKGCRTIFPAGSQYLRQDSRWRTSALHECA